MTYEEKIIKALTLVKDLEQLDYLTEKIQTTSQINRRTLQGRELTSKLLSLINKKGNELIENGEQPF